MTDDDEYRRPDGCYGYQRGTAKEDQTHRSIVPVPDMGCYWKSRARQGGKPHACLVDLRLPFRLNDVGVWTCSKRALAPFQHSFVRGRTLHQLGAKYPLDRDPTC